MINFFIRIHKYGNYAVEKWAQIKTRIWYKNLFGNIGYQSVIFKPIRLINPQNIQVGDKVRIYKDSRIETIEQWGKNKYTPRVIIGSGTTFEQRLHMTCASEMKIGRECAILADVMITDINHEYNEINKNVMSQSIEVKKTVVGDYCFIGMGSKIMAGSSIGNNCIIGSNSIVVGNIPEYSVVAGVPARIIKRYDFDNSKWRKTNEKGDFLDEL